MALRPRPRPRRDDRGMAMIMVMGYALAMVLAIGLLTSTAIESNKHARRDTDYFAALSAAQAGVDDYVSRLNANNVYWLNVDCTNTAMKKPMNGTCGWTATTPVGWVPLPGVKDPTGVLCTTVPLPKNCTAYHYDVDTVSTATTGSITVTSSGRSRNIVRTVRVVVQKKGFGDFLYYSDIESTDPANTYVYDGTPMTSTQAATSCSRHYWDSPARSGSCLDIQFITGDRINGPLHSNDAILMSGTPVFSGTTSTAWPNCAPSGNGVPKPVTSCYRATGSPAPNPSFARGLNYVVCGPPYFGPVLA